MNFKKKQKQANRPSGFTYVCFPLFGKLEGFQFIFESLENYSSENWKNGKASKQFFQIIWSLKMLPQNQNIADVFNNLPKNFAFETVDLLKIAWECYEIKFRLF